MTYGVSDGGVDQVKGDGRGGNRHCEVCVEECEVVGVDTPCRGDHDRVYLRQEHDNGRPHMRRAIFVLGPAKEDC